MGAIIQYSVLQVKETLAKNPIRTLICVTLPVIFYAIFWTIGLLVHPKEHRDIFDHLLTTGSFYILYLPLTYTAAIDLIEEKQNYRKQHLYSCGFGLIRYYISWLLIYFLLMLPSAIVITLLIFFTELFPHTSIFIIFIIILIFQLSNISLAFWLSVYFQSPITGAIFTLFCSVCVVSAYLITTYYFYIIKSKEFSEKNSISPIGQIITLIELYENKKANVNLSQIFSKDFRRFDINILIMLGIIIVFIVFACITDIFQLPKHLIKNRKDKKRHYKHLLEKAGEGGKKKKENDDDDKNVKIRAINLFKRYHDTGSGDMVVSNVSFKIMSNEIVSIAGNDSAGKSALIKMLYGKIPPSYGKVKYGKKKLNYWKWSSLCKKISVAPKQNYVFFEDSTVEEHIHFYSTLSGTKEKGVDLLKRINFLGRMEHKIKELNDLERTKLKIVLALLNNKNIVFLEEPTEGMGEEDLWSFWNIIHGKKNDRIIVFTTASIEEAKQQADHVMLLEKGTVEQINKMKTNLEQTEHIEHIEVVVKSSTSTN